MFAVWLGFNVRAMLRLCSCCSFAIFVPHFPKDLLVHGTTRADPPSGRLIGATKRECRRNVAHSSHLFCVPVWLFWTPVKLKEVTRTESRQLSNPNHVFGLSSHLCRPHRYQSVRVHFMITLLALRVGDLQVAVPGSEPLPAHDLPLQVPQRDVRPVKHRRVVAELGGKFIMNMCHGESKRQLLPKLSGPRQLTESLFRASCYGSLKLTWVSSCVRGRR